VCCLEAELKRRDETQTARDAAQTVRERELEERELEAKTAFTFRIRKHFKGSGSKSKPSREGAPLIWRLPPVDPGQRSPKERV
jgi:hypothetical protein